jgi:catechol 2,3-dioxygenase-like lactoylglutathione lyase family enzyme
MTRSRRVASVWIVVAAWTLVASGQAPSSGVAPPTADVQQVWHLGRVTGDLERIIRFYHDLLGLGFRGSREQALRFATNPAINAFVNVPPAGEYRAAFLPIPGASAETNPQNQIYLEAFEWRSVERRQMLPELFNPGVSSVRLLVRDLDAMTAAVKAAGGGLLTPGGQPLAVPTPAGLTGSARAIMVRDPDGYPVELMQVTPAAASPAAEADKVIGAHMSVIVGDLDASLAFYRALIGPDVQTLQGTGWQTNASFSRLRNIPEADYRTAAMLLPGSTIVLELVQFRGLAQTPYRPSFQDIGFGHVALVARDIERTLQRLGQLGSRPLATTGTWTRFSPTLRGLYTRDPDGFFLEIIERQ